MAKKLRANLIDPHNIDPADLPHYMADTYRGYMVSIKQRMRLITNIVNLDFGFVEFNREVLALQIRMIFELMSFAVLAFHQQESPIARSKRTKNDALDVIGLAGQYSWFESVCSSFEYPSIPQVVDIPFIKTQLSDPAEFKSLHGKLGALLHEQQRPRPTDHGRLSIDDLLSIRNEAYKTLSKHIIRDQYNQGWFIDFHADGQSENVIIGRVESSESA